MLDILEVTRENFAKSKKRKLTRDGFINDEDGSLTIFTL